MNTSDESIPKFSLFKEDPNRTLPAQPTSFKSAEPTQDSLVLIYPPGPEMGRRYELQGQTADIGRDFANNIMISNNSVSRKHARIITEGGRRQISDLQSTNGTYVNDMRIQSHFLNNGDQIKVGDTIFKYLVGNDVESDYHKELYNLTIKDGLTGIYNKRFFLEELERAMSRMQRYNRELSLLIFDLDHFKSVNDNFGHQAGDYVLRTLASEVSSRSRQEEVFARYGGEEFVILLQETAKDDALKLAEQVRQKVESHNFVFEGKEIPVTVSIGVATTNDKSLSSSAFISLADQSLYRAKDEGRNCVRG